MKRKMFSRSKILRRKLHNCGNGFKGEIVKTRGVVFCGFCGKEFSKK